jgi:uncharacterized protein (DUF2384 family)
MRDDHTDDARLHGTRNAGPSGTDPRDAAAIAQIIEMAESVLGDRESVRTWLNRPIPELEDESPLTVIFKGEAGAVATLLQNVSEGIPG